MRIRLWAQRYVAKGVEGLLRDATRPPGREPVSPERIATIVEMTLRTTPAHATHWTTRTMAKTAGISEAMVRRIWHQHGLQPHRVEHFKRSNDPRFVEKLRDIVGLYLLPPTKAVVFSVDEKSNIQALDRTRPVLALQPHVPERQTHDYIRHGTTTLFAAVRLLDGVVIGECHVSAHVLFGRLEHGPGPARSAGRPGADAAENRAACAHRADADQSREALARRADPRPQSHAG